MKKIYKISALAAVLLFCAGIVLAYVIFPAFYKSTVKGFVKANADLLLESLRTDALFLQMGGADGDGIEVSENRIYSMVWYEDAEFIFLPMQAKNESYELKLKKFFGKGYILTWELHSWGGILRDMMILDWPHGFILLQREIWRMNGLKQAPYFSNLAKLPRRDFSRNSFAAIERSWKTVRLKMME